MPVLNFGTLEAACTSATELTTVALARSLGRLSTRSDSSTSLSLVGLVRSVVGLLSAGTFGSDVDLKRSLKLGTAQGNCASKTSVQFFLNAVPAAPPVGALSLTSIDAIANPQIVPRGFSGSRFVRGDLIPIQFKVRGQKLQGLNATFTACRVDEVVGDPHDITKSGGAINLTDPVQQNNGVEIMTGNFTLNPNDTLSLPNGEIEFVYKFELSDGLGRVHTLESGRFRVYSVC